MIIAGIVLYTPDKEILKQNIESIRKQVDEVVVINNASTISISWLYEFIADRNINISIIENTLNRGVAHALNQIMEYGEEAGAEWVLTLDQDSVCPDNLINIYRKYISIPRVAVLSPLMLDRNSKVEKIDKGDGIQEIARCITSASLNNVGIWKQLGGFEEILFIDYVDFEYCCRVRENNFKIYRCNEAVLLHRLGDMSIKRMGKQSIHVTNHSASRRYYYARNACCCHKWHKKEYPLNKLIYHIGVLALKILFYEEKKIYKLKEIIRGIHDSKNIKKQSKICRRN